MDDGKHPPGRLGHGRAAFNRRGCGNRPARISNDEHEVAPNRTLAARRTCRARLQRHGVSRLSGRKGAKYASAPGSGPRRRRNRARAMALFAPLTRPTLTRHGVSSSRRATPKSAPSTNRLTRCSARSTHSSSATPTAPSSRCSQPSPPNASANTPGPSSPQIGPDNFAKARAATSRCRIHSELDRLGHTIAPSSV